MNFQGSCLHAGGMLRLPPPSGGDWTMLRVISSTEDFIGTAIGTQSPSPTERQGSDDQ